MILALDPTLPRGLVAFGARREEISGREFAAAGEYTVGSGRVKSDSATRVRRRVCAR
jgi:hypothetical protein